MFTSMAIPFTQPISAYSYAYFWLFWLWPRFPCWHTIWLRRRESGWEKRSSQSFEIFEIWEQFISNYIAAIETAMTRNRFATTRTFYSVRCFYSQGSRSLALPEPGHSLLIPVWHFDPNLFRYILHLLKKMWWYLWSMHCYMDLSSSRYF